MKKIKPGNRHRSFFLLFLIGVAVGMTPAYEQIYPGIFRHLTPVYLTILAYLLYLIKGITISKPFKTPYWLISLFFLIALSFIECIWANDLEAALSESMRVLYIGMAILLMWHLELTSKERLWGMWGLIFGSVIFVMTIISGNIEFLINPDKYNGLINRNITGSILATGFAAIFYIYTETKKKYYLLRIAQTGLMLIFVYFIVTTFSRSSILALLLFLSGYFISAKKMPNKILIIAVLLFGIYAIRQVADYTQRLKIEKGSDLDHTSSGRADIWKSILLELPDTYYLGAGTANTRSLLAKNDYYLSTIYGRGAKGGVVAHNFTLKILGENGIPGLLLYLVFTFGMISFAWKVRHLNYFILGGALVCTTFVQFHDYTIPPWFLMALMLPVAEIREDVRKKYFNIRAMRGTHHSAQGSAL